MKINLVFISTLFIGASLFSSMNTLAVTPATAPKASTLSAEEVKQIQKVVHDYLVQNPQVLVEASQAYQEQELAKAKNKTQQAIAKNAKALFTAPNSPVVGNRNGNVTVVEFLDYQCTHCREMSGVVTTLVKGDDQVRVVFKELPIFGGSSKYAAQASIAAMRQGPDKFLSFHKALLEAPAPLTNEKVLAAAKSVGLNVPQLESDIKSKTTEEQINDNFRLAQALSLLGTPAFIVANRSGSHLEYIPGVVTVDSLKQTITNVRK